MAKQKINNNNSNNIEAGHNSNSSTIQQQHKYVFLPSTGLEVAHGSARIPRWLRQTPYSVKISVLASDGIWKALTRTGSDRMLYTDQRSDVIYWSTIRCYILIVWHSLRSDGIFWSVGAFDDQMEPSSVDLCPPQAHPHTQTIPTSQWWCFFLICFRIWPGIIN